MAQKKTKRYVVVNDIDGDLEVWALHADLTMRRTALSAWGIVDGDIPVVDTTDRLRLEG